VFGGLRNLFKKKVKNEKGIEEGQLKHLPKDFAN
jgi:hypothetical protein